MMKQNANNDKSRRPGWFRRWLLNKKIFPLVIVATAVVVVLVLGAILPKKEDKVWKISIGCYTLSYTPKKEDDKKATPPAPANVRVQVVEPRPVVEDAFWIPGVVEPNCIVEVAAEVSARVEACAVDEGDTVRKAQPILYLNTDLLAARRNRARAEFDFHREELVRIKSIYEKKIATRMEVDQVQMRYNVAKAALKVTEANLQRTTIVAPVEGVLNRLGVEVGEYVAPGTVVAEIVQMDTVKVVLEVPERDIGYLKVAQEVRIVHNLADPKNSTGRITYISELADKAARTTRVELSVDNRRGIFRSGQIVQARVVRRRLKDIIMIPLRAVIPLEEGYVVYVDNGGKAKRREVRLNKTLLQDQHIGILSGLATGERLIVQGQRLVGPGQAVRVAKDAPATQPETAPADNDTRRGK